MSRYDHGRFGRNEPMTYYPRVSSDELLPIIQREVDKSLAHDMGNAAVDAGHAARMFARLILLIGEREAAAASAMLYFAAVSRGLAKPTLDDNPLTMDYTGDLVSGKSRVDLLGGLAL